MLLPANRDTVSPGARPYDRTRALLKWVATSFTSQNDKQEEGSEASMYAPEDFASDGFATGEVERFSNAHCHVVKSVGTRLLLVLCQRSLVIYLDTF